MKATDTLIKHYDRDDETGEMIPRRFMNADEIKEREQLQVANTASAKRKAVVEELAKRGSASNGHAIHNNIANTSK